MYPYDPFIDLPLLCWISSEKSFHEKIYSLIIQARKRTFQEALKALFVSGTAVSGKDFVITVSNLVPRASLGPQFQSDSKMVAAPI